MIGLTSTIDISPDHMGMVQEILRENLPSGVAVWVFGSRASWNTRDSSDLDLALEGDSALNHDTIINLEMAFEESDLPYKVDIIDLNQVSDSFRRIVQAQMVPLIIERIFGESVDQNWVPVSDVATIIVGGTPSRSVKKYWHGEIPWATAKDVASVSGRYLDSTSEFITTLGLESSAAKLMPKGTIVITARGTVGSLVQLGQDMAFNQTCYALIPKNGICPGFLFYALKSTLHQMHALTHGTIFDTITRTTFSNWYIPVPHLSKQKTIAYVLGTLDAKIKINRRMNQTLEAMARALFKSWFVDFEPVRAKMDGRWQRGESHLGLPAEYYDIFPDCLVKTELGYIPKGWEVKTLAEFATVVYGATFASKRFNNLRKGLPLIRIRDLSSHNPSVFTDEKHPKGQQIQPGDIVVGMDGEFRAYIWRGPTSWLNQRVCHFQPLQGIPRQFLFEALIDPLAGFERSKVGTTVIHLGKADIDSIKLVRPPADVFDVFASCTDPMIQRVVINAAEARLLAVLRDTLLPNLVNAESFWKSKLPA